MAIYACPAGVDMTQEALKLALEALENGDVPTPENAGKNLDAITAIKEALAQPHEMTLKEFNQQIHDDPNYHIWVKEREDRLKPELDALQVLANENQRMAKVIAELDAQRTWVGLTDKQTTQVIKSMPKGIKGWMIDWDLHDFSKAIEAKLKEKNT
jgi:hypothetical protein